jgi:hypothetical protein
LGDAPRDPARLGVPCAERAAQAVNQSSLDLVYDRAWKIVVAKGVAISNEAIREHDYLNGMAVAPLSSTVNRVISIGARRSV